ncbi:hypothetical protein GC176_09840 [bacterium]|nr:hypothetical protein [bacterium]
MDGDQFVSPAAVPVEITERNSRDGAAPLMGEPTRFQRPDRFEAATAGSTPADVWPADLLAETYRSSLSGEFRLLCVGPLEPDWIGLTLQLDAAGCVEPQMRWVNGASATMTLLRNESFNAIVISCDDSAPNGTDVDELDWHPESLVDAIRASGCSDPIILISTRPDDSLTNLACRHHCDLLVSAVGWSSRALVNVIQSSIRRVDLQRENHHLAVANHRRLVRERDEADHLLDQQHGIIRELEALANGLSLVDSERDCEVETNVDSAGSEADASSRVAAVRTSQRPVSLPIPDQIKSYYHELLRTYVIMGSGSLGGEIVQLAAVLAEVGLSPRDTLSLHLERVEQLVRGLGNRSTRHVLARADLLALELIIHLGECYQRAAQSPG